MIAHWILPSPCMILPTREDDLSTNTVNRVPETSRYVLLVNGPRNGAAGTTFETVFSELDGPELIQ